MNESDTRLKLIDPAIKAAGWDVAKQVHTEYYFTDGEIVVRGKITTRKQPKKADYLLTYLPNTPLAVIEAKASDHSVGDGMQQAVAYATALDVPYAYSTNGSAFLEHDMLTGKETELPMDALPGPDQLWARYCAAKGFTSEAEQVITTPYYSSYDTNSPRYYQRVAINRTIEAVAAGQKRILLVMATGTGKTYTAFQIVHRLRQTAGVKKVLYLADRNVLVDQTISGDFKPLQKVTTKVQSRTLDSSYEVYFSLYQQLVGVDGEEIFREFSPSFFDLIIVDECHRGSALADSAWRKVLEYFDGAIQIGMTATPKETKEVSNIDYFGNPVFVYSLKQGIKDGFLAPYKVIRPKLDIDVFGFRPEEGTIDDRGYEVEDRVYEMNDFDRSMVIAERTAAVAKKVTEHLKATDRFAKTIVFCVDIDHAERMRQALVNENSDLVAINPKYVMRITGDNAEGKAELDNFMDPDEKYPTIVTTSKLLTTGVNCKTCRVIVLDNVFGEQGMTEFKQIIGRGTRISEPYDKLYFTILDFRNASRLFADPDFDGEPIPDDGYDPNGGEIEPPVGPNGDGDEPPLPPPPPPSQVKYYLHGIPVTIASERVEYYATDGGLVTESFKDFTRKNILGAYDTLDHFINAWNAEAKKDAIIAALREQGVFLEVLREESGQYQMSDFDLICHVAYDKKPLTRSERANNVKKRGYLYEYNEVAQRVLETLLDKYATSNLVDLTDTHILDLEEFKQFGSPMKIVTAFGGKQQYLKAVRDLQNEIYTA